MHKAVVTVFEFLALFNFSTDSIERFNWKIIIQYISE